MDQLPRSPVASVLIAVFAALALAAMVLGGVLLFQWQDQTISTPPPVEAAPAAVPVAALPLPPDAPAAPVVAAPAVGLNEPAVVDGVSVTVTAAITNRREDELWLAIAIRTDDPKKKYGYGGWHQAFGRQPRTKLSDDNGNEYAARILDPMGAMELKAFLSHKLGGGADVGPGAVYSGKPRLDVLVFERPVDKFGVLNLELDGSGLGVEGMFRFRLTQESLSDPAAAKARAAADQLRPPPVGVVDLPKPVVEAPKPAPPPPPTPAFKVGARVALTNAAKVVALGRNKGSLEEYQKAIAANETETIDRLVSAGKVLRVAAGSRAEVLAIDEGVYWVKVLSGPHADRLGYIATSDAGKDEPGK